MCEKKSPAIATFCALNKMRPAETRINVRTIMPSSLIDGNKRL